MIICSLAIFFATFRCLHFKVLQIGSVFVSTSICIFQSHTASTIHMPFHIGRLPMMSASSEKTFRYLPLSANGLCAPICFSFCLLQFPFHLQRYHHHSLCPAGWWADGADGLMSDGVHTRLIWIFKTEYISCISPTTLMFNHLLAICRSWTASQPVRIHWNECLFAATLYVYSMAFCVHILPFFYSNEANDAETDAFIKYGCNFISTKSEQQTQSHHLNAEWHFWRKGNETFQSKLSGVDRVVWTD